MCLTNVVLFYDVYNNVEGILCYRYPNNNLCNTTVDTTLVSPIILIIGTIFGGAVVVVVVVVVLVCACVVRSSRKKHKERSRKLTQRSNSMNRLVVSTMFAELKWMTLPESVLYQKAIQMFKTARGNAPKYLRTSTNNLCIAPLIFKHRKFSGNSFNFGNFRFLKKLPVL